MFRIVINPTFESLRPFIEALPSQFESCGTEIFRGRNVLKRYETGNRSLVVKRFKRPHLINRFVYVTLRLSKAARSYHNALRLLRLGIDTPQPIAYIEERHFGLCHSYLVTTELQDMEELRRLHELLDPEHATTLLRELGRFTAEMHEKGVLHKDFSPGNLLFRIDEGKAIFSLVDINRMRFGTVSEEEGYRNFERLWLPDDDFTTLAEAYATSRGYDPKRAVERICHYKNRYMR